MNVNDLRDELSSISGCISNDLEYLTYLIIKKKDSEMSNTNDTKSIKPNKDGDEVGYVDFSIEDWFNNI